MIKTYKNETRQVSELTADKYWSEKLTEETRKCDRMHEEKETALILALSHHLEEKWERSKEII